MTKKQLIVSSAILLAALGSYDLYKLKFTEGVGEPKIEELSKTEHVVPSGGDVIPPQEGGGLSHEEVRPETETPSQEDFLNELGLEDASVEGAFAEDKEGVALLDEFEVEFQSMESPKNANETAVQANEKKDEPFEASPEEPSSAQPKTDEEEIAALKDEAKKERIAFYESKVTLLNEESDKLKERVISYEVSTSELRKKLGVLEQKSFALKGEISYLNAMLKDVKERSQKEVVSLNENLRGYQEQLKKNNEEIGLLREKNNRLKLSVRESEENIIALNGKVEKGNSEAKVLKDRLAKSIQSTESQQIKIEVMKDKVAKAESRSRALQADQAEAYKRLEEVKASKAKTEQRIRDILVRNNEIEQILIKKESEIDGNNKQILFLKGKVDSILKEKREENNRLFKAISQKKEEISTIKKENKEKRGEIISLLKKVDELTQVLEGLKRNRDDLKKEVEKGNEQRVELLGIIKLKEEGNKKIGKALSESKVKNRELMRRVEELKKDKLQLQFNHEKRVGELEHELRGSQEKYKTDIIEAKYDTVKVIDVKTVGSSNERYDREIAKVLGSSNESLLEELAKNPKLNKDILRGLAKNSSPYIRNEVAKNPSITKEIVKILSYDEVGMVKMSLMDNPKVTRDALEKMKSDKEDKVKEYAEYKLLRFK